MLEEQGKKKDPTPEEMSKMMSILPETRQWLEQLPDEDDLNAIVITGNLVARKAYGENGAIPEKDVDLLMQWTHETLTRLAILHLVSLGLVEAHFSDEHPNGKFKLSERGRQSGTEILDFLGIEDDFKIE